MKGPLGILFIFCIVTANAVYVPHSVELDLRQQDVANELATLIERHTNELDLLLPKYAPFLISSILEPLRADIAAVHEKYLTPDFTSYAPIDGYFIVSRDAMTGWYVDVLNATKLKYQSHIYGPYVYKIVQLSPLVIEVNTTQMVSGFSENPFYSPVPFMQQDKLQSSILSAHLVYQYTQVDGKWLMNHKNEDFSKIHTFCQHTCSYLARLNPHCADTTGSCTVIQANPNSVLNPLFPPPLYPQYFSLRMPTVIVQ